MASKSRSNNMLEIYNLDGFTPKLFLGGYIGGLKELKFSKFSASLNLLNPLVGGSKFSKFSSPRPAKYLAC